MKKIIAVLFLILIQSITAQNQYNLPIIPPCPSDSYRTWGCVDGRPPYKQWDWKGPKFKTKTITIPSCQIACNFTIEYYDRDIICYNQGNEVNRWYDLYIAYVQHEDDCSECIDNFEDEIFDLIVKEFFKDQSLFFGNYWGE